MKAKNWKYLWVSFLTIVLLTSKSYAVSVVIDFERTGIPAATVGMEARHLYADLGVTFPSGPTIQRDFTGQVLRQGDSSSGPGSSTCSPLEMSFDRSMGVRQVTMRVINRHLRYYSVQALSISGEVDQFQFWPSPPRHFPPRPEFFREITLRAAEGEGHITRIVATPPSDCFDLMAVDNLRLETLHGPVPVNYSRALAYEVNQGVMSHLTILSDARGLSRPDTRLKALPEKQLPLISGRDTGIRFFLGASRSEIHRYNPTLEVKITYLDGSNSTKRITENTESIGGRSELEPVVPVTPIDIASEDLRRALIKRRANVDQSLDFVIPGPSLLNVSRADLSLFSPDGERLAWVEINFEGSYTMGINFIRVNGVRRAAPVGPPPPLEPTLSAIRDYMKAVMPVSDSIRFRNFGILTRDAAPNCEALLSSLEGAFAGIDMSIPDVNYWSSMYVARNPPGCDGVGWYNVPAALTNSNPSTAAHEIGHNIGINHASNVHGEPLSGGDWELWPYLHGSIGAADETGGDDFGVFGLVIKLNEATSGADLIENWGTWKFSPIQPCQTASDAVLFPACGTPDSRLVHDYMSYSPGGKIPILGPNLNWTSDINFFRITRFFQECIVLDPPHRFFSGSTGSFVDRDGECRGPRIARAGTSVPASGSGTRLMDGLVFSGELTEEGSIESLRVIRKPILSRAVTNDSGEYALVMRAGDGKVIRTLSFQPRISTMHAVGPNRSFIVVAPYHEKLMNIEVTYKGQPIFKRSASPKSPTVKILSPSFAETWRKGIQHISWRSSDGDGDRLQVFVQYSPDAGRTWLPLALLDDDTGDLQVQVEDLVPSKEALVYISVSDGLNSAAIQLEKPFLVGPNG